MSDDPAGADAFRAYLTRSGLAPATVGAYVRFVAELRARLPDVEAATRADVVAYLAHLRARGLGHGTRAGRLSALKAYYDHLTRAGVRDDHPCRSLTLRAPPRPEHVDHARLYTRGQLAALLADVRAAGDPVRLALAGLLCHQALAPAEACVIAAADVDLDAGTLRAPGTRSIDARVLPLRAAQALALADYLRDVRPRLIAGGVRGAWRPAAGRDPPTALLLSEWGRPLLRQRLPSLLNAGRPREAWVTPLRVRQSVLAHLLSAGYDVSVVQAFAGHRFPSSTEHYRTGDLADLAAVVTRLHPRR